MLYVLSRLFSLSSVFFSVYIFSPCIIVFLGEESVSADIEKWSSTFDWLTDDSAKTYFEFKTSNHEAFKVSVIKSSLLIVEGEIPISPPFPSAPVFCRRMSTRFAVRLTIEGLSLLLFSLSPASMSLFRCFVLVRLLASPSSYLS